MTKPDIKKLIEDSKKNLTDKHGELEQDIRREIGDHKRKALERT